MKVKPKDLTRLAEAVLDGSTEVSSAWQRFLGSSVVPAAAFGNLTVGAELYGAGVTVAESANAAVEALTGVLEGDVDRLYQAAFAYEEADNDAKVPLDRLRLDLQPGRP